MFARQFIAAVPWPEPPPRRRRQRRTRSRSRSRGKDRGQQDRRLSARRTNGSRRGSARSACAWAMKRFNVPGKGPSRDVIAIRDAASDCLVIAMAHTDSVPPAPGAHDNASGVGTLVALARALATGPEPTCDVWLVATGAEERPYTGRPDHPGPQRPRLDGSKRDGPDRRRQAGPLARRGRPRNEVRPALDRRGAPRANLEQRIIDAGDGSVRWVRDPEGQASPTIASSRGPGCRRRSSGSSRSPAGTRRATRQTGSSAAPSRGS